MTKIENTFNDVMVCNGDIWVADYRSLEENINYIY